MCMECELNLSNDEAFFVSGVVSKRVTSKQALDILKGKYKSIYNFKELEALLTSIEKHLHV